MKKDSRPVSIEANDLFQCSTLGVKKALDNCKDDLSSSGSAPVQRDSWSTLRCLLHAAAVIVLTLFTLDLLAVGFISIPMSHAAMQDLAVIGGCAAVLAVIHLTAPKAKARK